MPQLYPASFLPFAATSATYIYTLSLHDALPIYTTHDIKIQSGTHLAGLIGQETILVNSHHHQGIRSLANNLLDRKSTRLNSSHTVISYAVFCLKKKRTICAGPVTPKSVKRLGAA